MNSALKQLIHPILLGIIAVVMYHPIVKNSFSGLDDVILVEENWDYLSEISYLPTVFSEDVFLGNENFYYRPILTASYMWDVLLSHSAKPLPQVFFYTNLFLLTLIGILLYSFLGNFGFSANYRFGFSAMYLIHPILPSMVAWIPGRNDLLLIVFTLVSLHMLIKYLQNRNKWYAIIHLAFFTLAIFTKESGILISAFGFLLFLYFSDWDGAFSLKKGLQKIGDFASKNLLIILSWALLIGFYFVLRNHALSEKHFTILGYIASIFRGIPDLLPLLQAAIFPLHLHVFQSLDSTEILPSIALIFAFSIAIWKIQPTRKNLLFGTLWFFTFLVPTLISSLIMFHRLALPLIGFAFVFSPLEKWFTEKIFLFWGMASVWVIFSVHQNLDFQKSFSTAPKYWKSAISGSPSSALAVNGLAWSFHQNNQLDSAQMYYEKVLQIVSTKTGTRMALALISENNGQFGTTDSLLNAELRFTQSPEFVEFFRGQILLERGDTTGAISALNLGKEATTYSRNAREFYKGLPQDILIRLDGGN